MTLRELVDRIARRHGWKATEGRRHVPLSIPQGRERHPRVILGESHLRDR